MIESLSLAQRGFASGEGHFAGTSMISLTGVPSLGSSFLFVSSFTYFSSFMVRFVWNTV